MTLMPCWPAGFLPTPDAENWEGAPFDSRLAFAPEAGPPLFRRRVTAEAWQFSGRFPAADQAEQTAFWQFWREIEEGSKPFLWRDPETGEPRKWMFGADEPVRTSSISDTHKDFQLRLIRLPSTPWWAWMIPADRTVAPRAAYDFKRGLYDAGNGPIGRPAAFSFSRASTGSYIGADGTIQQAGNDVPRFDHHPLTRARRGLLIEAARMNLLHRSAELDVTPWVKLACTVQANSGIAPDGVMAADRMVPNAGAAPHTSGIYQSVGGSGNAAATWSIWVRPSGLRPRVQVQCRDAAVAIIGSATATIEMDGSLGANVANGIAGPEWRIEPYASGWVRVSFSGTTPAATTSVYLVIFSADAGDGVGGVGVWGAQIESQRLTTSYIPTAGGPAARAADTAGLVAAHGLCDVRVIYDDGTVDTLLSYTLPAGWWPPKTLPHIAGIAIFEPGALA